MADNTTLNTGSGGDTIRTLDDGTVKWPAGVTAFATTVGTPDVLSVVTPAAGLPVHQQTGATWAVSLASVPSHAVTNAGTFAVQVDGGALTALQLIDDIVYADDAAWTGDSSKHALVGGIYQSSPQTVTDGRTAPILLDANGKIQVATHAVTQSGTWNVGTVTTVTTVSAVTAISNALPAGNNNIGDVDVASIAAGDNNIGNVDVVTVPADPFGANADAASATGSISAKLRFIAATGIPITGTVTVGSHAVTNAGTFVVQVDGAALTSLQLLDDAVFTDDAAFTPGTSKGLAVGFQADEAAIDSVDEGDFGVPRITLDRKVITNPQPHAAGGCSIFRSLDLDETEEEVKASAGCVYGGMVTNTSTGTRWIKFYNATAANVTVGSTTPVITWGIPGNATDDLAAVFNTGGMGVQFDTAITVAATTGVADADTGAPGANDVIINLFYK